MTEFARPQPLGEAHDLTGFDSGQSPLDDWLADRAPRNQRSGAPRTFVVTAAGQATVVGFYSLASSSVHLAAAPGTVRRNMPAPIPVILLGRLAVDHSCQGLGLGRALLQDAVRRVLAAGQVVGVRALLVHALDDDAAGFYRHFGFIASPLDDCALFLPLDRLRASAAVVA
ncbi:MAG: GNAT family N-acetyltransferase [Propionibacteriaceae bacterium]|nr:GNAT family N-acetyltransferase [Propionibacteriaceae bacterium]